MSRGVTLPFFPSPPRDYDQSYFAQMTRNFSVFAQQSQVPGPLQASTLVLTNLPSDDMGLGTGAVFEHGGFLKVSFGNTPHVRGVTSIGAVGGVTVATS